ncbi:MAG: TonB family protein [Terriglobales bacterium]
MAIIKIPLQDPYEEVSPRDEGPGALQSSLPFDGGKPAEPVAAPVLLIQLQDDLARSRLREAFWISVVVHLLLVITFVAAPKYLPMHRLISARSAEDLLRERQATFLELPADQQKVTTRPKTNIISDKDRTASSRTPQIDRKTLDELRDARRPGAPGPGGQPTPQSPPVVGQMPPQQNPANGMRGTPPPPPSNQSAQLQSPPISAKEAFGSAMSPRSAIEQAARATSRGGYGGSVGDYGMNAPGGARTNLGGPEILSDTMGVDFGPYLARVLHDVRFNWYQLIPEVARAPLMKRGNVAIEFAIMKDGSVAGMRLVYPSGDVSLDRAAWGGITASNPFPPLPGEFKGQYLALRFRFLYNPLRGEMQ